MNDPAARARDLFLRDENTYGCAETGLVALQEHFGFDNPGDATPAMALNGGIAYTGGICGAITGAALAIGRLAGERITDHRDAKKAARLLTQDLIREFRTEFTETTCDALTGYDMLVDHDAFIESDVWRTACMRQIEMAVTHAGQLNDPEIWEAEVARVVAAGDHPGGLRNP